MRKIFKILLVFAMLAAFVLPAAADEETAYSREIVIDIITNDPTEYTDDVTGVYSITYVDEETGKTSDYSYDMVGEDNPKPTIKSCMFTAPKGKVFSGWTTVSGGTVEATYQAGRVIELSKNLTLYAVWVDSGEEKTSTVYYHENTGDYRTKKKTYKDGQVISLPGVFWDHDMKFLGWAEDPDSEVGIKGKVAVEGEETDLYAIWERSSGKDCSIYKYITNLKWDSNGRVRLFEAGDTVHFNIVVENTGSKDLTNVKVYDTLSGAKIKSGSGYHREDHDTAVIDFLGVGDSVTVKAEYTVKSSDLTKRRLVNQACVWFGKERSDYCRIPIRRYKEYVDYTTTITVYADSSISQPLNRVISTFELAYPDYSVNVVYGTDATTVNSMAAYGGRDVIITVGRASMDSLDISADSSANPNRVNRIVSSTRTVPMENRAVLAGRTGTVITFNQLSGVLSSGQAKLAVVTGTGMSAKFASEIASHLNLDLPTLKATGAVVEYSTVAEAAGAVLSGAADLCIVSGSEASAYGLAAADTAKDSICTAVQYPAAMLRDSTYTTASQAFLTYLRSAQARSTFTEFGYTAK